MDLQLQQQMELDTTPIITQTHSQMVAASQEVNSYLQPIIKQIVCIKFNINIIHLLEVDMAQTFNSHKLEIVTYSSKNSSHNTSQAQME